MALASVLCRGAVVLCVGAAAADSLNGTVDAAHPSTCCGSMLGGTCHDGSYGTPCCGNGGCNVFCCNCDGGCRAAPAPAPPAPTPAASATSTPLNKWPMIMTHDSATSYYDTNTCILAKAVGNYVMTQVPGTFTDQLNCGARAFDLRAKAVGSSLIAHHGAVGIQHAISDILTELVQWASHYPTELVLVYGSHCAGTNCTQMFKDTLDSSQIPRIECEDVAGLTLGTALTRGHLPNGGSVLAVQDCVDENYEPSITCYGDLLGHAINDTNRTSLSAGVDQPRSRFSCYGSDSQMAFDPLWAYMNKTCGVQHQGLWMAQAHWQNDASTIAQGEVDRSCILKDESKAGVNDKLAQKIAQGLFPNINLLEVDDLCGGHGPALFKALRSRFTYDVAEYMASREAIVV